MFGFRNMQEKLEHNFYLSFELDFFQQNFHEKSVTIFLLVKTDKKQIYFDILSTYFVACKSFFFILKPMPNKDKYLSLLLNNFVSVCNSSGCLQSHISQILEICLPIYFGTQNEFHMLQCILIQKYNTFKEAIMDSFLTFLFRSEALVFIVLGMYDFGCLQSFQHFI